jgi:hypothetical protein
MNIPTMFLELFQFTNRTLHFSFKIIITNFLRLLACLLLRSANRYILILPTLCKMCHVLYVLSSTVYFIRRILYCFCISGGWVSSSNSHGSSLIPGHVGFLVDKAALEQVYSEYFGFSCRFSLHQLLRILPSTQYNFDPDSVAKYRKLYCFHASTLETKQKQSKQKRNTPSHMHESIYSVWLVVQEFLLQL